MDDISFSIVGESSILVMQEPARCLGRIPSTTTVKGNTTFPTFVEGELQLTQTLDGHKVTPGRKFVLWRPAMVHLLAQFVWNAASCKACSACCVLCTC